MICPKCGAQNLPTNKFCTHCGATLPQIQQVTAPPTKDLTVTPVSQPLVRQYEVKSMSLGEIFDIAFRIYSGNFKMAFFTYAVVAIPLLLVSTIFTTSILKSQSPASISLFMIPFGIISGLIYLISQSAMIKLLSDVYIGYKTSISTAYRYAINKFFPLLFTSIFMFVLVGFASILLVIPGIVLMIYYFFYLHTIILENRSLMNALGRSLNLVRGFWWRTLLLFFVIFILSMLVVGIFTYLPTFVSFYTAPSVTLTIITSFLSGISQMFLQPFLSAIWLLFYYDLRIRKEGFDLEVKAMEIK